MVIAGVVAVILIVVVAILWGRREETRASTEKRRLLGPREGQYVTLGIGLRFVAARTGRVIATDDPFAVTFDDDGVRAIPLADVRWIDGPNGQRLGGPLVGQSADAVVLQVTGAASGGVARVWCYWSAGLRPAFGLATGRHAGT